MQSQRSTVRLTLVGQILGTTDGRCGTFPTRQSQKAAGRKGRYLGFNGRNYRRSLRASCNLAALGCSCRVISMHTIKPLDTAALSLAAAETGGIVTIEEHAVDGGLGGAVAEVLLEATTRPRFFQRIRLRAGFSSVVGSQEYLRHVYDLDADAITRKTLACLNGINATKG